MAIDKILRTPRKIGAANALANPATMSNTGEAESYRALGQTANQAGNDAAFLLKKREDATSNITN